MSNLCSVQIAKQLNPAAAVADRPICCPRQDHLARMSTTSSSSLHSPPTLLFTNKSPVVGDYKSCYNKTPLSSQSRDSSYPSKTVYLDNKHEESSGNSWGIQITVLSGPTSPDSDAFSNAADEVAQIPTPGTHIEDIDSMTTSCRAAHPQIEPSDILHDVDAQSQPESRSIEQPQQPSSLLKRAISTINSDKTSQNLADKLFLQQRVADKVEDGRGQTEVTADKVLDAIESNQSCTEDDDAGVLKDDGDRDEADEGDTGTFWHSNLPGIFSRPSRPVIRRARTEPRTGTRTTATIDDSLARDETWATQSSFGDSAITDPLRTETGPITMQKFYGVLKRNPPSDFVMSAQLRQSMLASSKIRDAGSTVQRSRVWHVAGMAPNAG